MAVDEIITQLQRAWNAGDGTAWAAAFADDAEFVDVLGRVVTGRQAIGEEHQKILDTIYRDSRIEIRPLARHRLAEDVLLVRTESHLRAPTGPRAGDTLAVQSMVLRDGRIFAFHNTIRSDLAAFTGKPPA
jgi:uncharacterized protein (TIGR02246 family)